MAPKFACSNSLHRLALEPIVSCQNEKLDKRTLCTSIIKPDTKWLETLAESRMSNNEVFQLTSSFGLRWTWYAGGNFLIKIQLRPWLRLLQACGNTLRELSVEICRDGGTAPDHPFGWQDISKQMFDEVWDCVKQAL